MTTVEDRLARLSLAAVPVAIGTVVYCVSLLPRSVIVDALTLLAVWLSFSLPLGVIVGHCALSEVDC